jgi:DNA-directed RNA polymerase I, II, and III subunit RPABC2
MVLNKSSSDSQESKKEKDVYSKQASKKENIDDENDIEDQDGSNDEFEAQEEEFFNENNFKNANTNIKFHVYDPDKYKNEIHQEIIIIPPEYRKTSEVITKFEFTDVVSNRAKQIENGSKIFVDIGTEDNPIIMAEMEIKMKQCPLSIRRFISNNIAEIWNVNEMIIPYFK